MMVSARGHLCLVYWFQYSSLTPMESFMKHESTPQSSPSPRRDRHAILDPGNLLLLLYPTMILVLLLLVGIVRAEASASAPQFDPDSIRQGELLLPDPEGRPVAATQLRQDIQVTVTGVVARVQLTQEFVNSGDEWLTGIYVFPLPDEAAVDRLRMRVGEREIVGEIREKAEAERIFREAAAEGRKSSLLAQNRPNLFTTSVANIGPKEMVQVTMEYQQQVQFQNGVFSLRYPLAVTPRYIPGTPVNDERVVRAERIAFDATGWARDTDRVPDASKITPPQIASPDQQPSVRLTIDLAAGFPLARLDSLYHPLQRTELGENRFRLNAEQLHAADHDIVLEWVPESREIAAALFSETMAGETYRLLMVMAPGAPSGKPAPRELVFILDVSGSMAGPSIRQAKQALRQALAELQPDDRFNVISFSSSAHRLFAMSRPASSANLAIGDRYLAGLKADGGTEMREALELALSGEASSGLMRQVVFLTDGAVGNEAELFSLIGKGIGTSRLFTVGIGAAPNAYFMTRAATLGRGTYTYIGNVDEVGRKVSDLLYKLRYPAITNLHIAGADERMEIYPSPLPDLYHGEPLVLAIRKQGDGGTMQLVGRQGDHPFTLQVDTSASGLRPGIAALWARKKIRSEMEALSLGKDEAVVRDAVLRTALEHQPVSYYTSLVAVDSEVTRPESAEPGVDLIPTPAPRGLQMEMIFGGGSRTATPATALLLAGLLMVTSALLLRNGRTPWARRY